jgi:hypothetical protein
MFEGYRELLMAHQAAKEMAEKFVGEPVNRDEPYSRYILYTEPVTDTMVYYAMGADNYDLVIPRGVLSSILMHIPWSLKHLSFHGVDETGSIFVEFSQLGPWRERTTETFGDVLIFDDVHPKKIDNLEACERIEVYRSTMEEIIKDAINAAKKENNSEKSQA